jgi:hypothetical protein
MLKPCPDTRTYRDEPGTADGRGRDGKIENVDKITVSPDGKKMTTVVDNKPTGRVSTYIDEKQ